MMAAVGEAPGRLDVLGGVADYSGSLVLETPLRATTRVTITPIAEPRLVVTSGDARTVSVPLPEFGSLVTAEGDPAAGRAWLDEHDVEGWARYPLGCLMLFARHFSWSPSAGLAITIDSGVPVSMGVSSSAALEVATLRALEHLSGRRFTDTALARLAQRAENHVVGAPCGLMDQLAAAHGVPGALLPILCRPDVLHDPVRLPAGMVVAGWPSGVAHTVSGSPYGTARTAAFMAKTMLASHLGRPLDFLAELPPSVVHGIDAAILPSSISGTAFVERHGGVDDPLSRIDPSTLYPVRAAAIFATEENFRAGIAMRLLRGGLASADAATTIGELMAQSHLGYTAIGLGAAETDAMVAAVRARGPAHGFHGARISGGGCGGTVVVLLDAAALPSLEQLAADLTGTSIIL